MTNRKLLVFVGPVVGLVMFAAAVKMASVSRASQGPDRVPTVQSEGLAGEKLDAENKARAKPYEEAE